MIQSTRPEEQKRIVDSKYIKFSAERFIVRKEAIKGCLHVPASENNPMPTTMVFWDHFSQEIPDPKMNVFHYIELVLLKPDVAPEVE
ncbi:MAG: hypothetical protein SFY92_00615 [Verrucomicrobiae bacterium]|nr:hypothetical protein [Verrucomicrobiae bacterium]